MRKQIETLIFNRFNSVDLDFFEVTSVKYSKNSNKFLYISTAWDRITENGIDRIIEELTNFFNFVAFSSIESKNKNLTLCFKVVNNGQQ